MAVATKQQKRMSPAKFKDEVKIQDKFKIVRKELNDALIEREEETDMLLTALLCGENPLLVGPPGTAKSKHIDLLMDWMVDSRKFSWQINKFTTPEELFGPISIKGLENDEFYRITKGKLPEATGVYLDEIFNGSSAILNTLLKIMNERMFDNGSEGPQKVPVLFIVSSSNQYPNDMEGGKELGAMFDRFLFRKSVKYITSAEGRTKLLWSYQDPVFSHNITADEIVTARLQKERIPFHESAVHSFAEIVEELAKEGISPGDRRQRKSVDACRAYAYLMGADEVQKEHLEILSHVLWVDPVEQPQKCAKIVSRIANPIQSKVVELVSQAREVLQKNTTDDSISKLREIQEKLDEMHKYGAVHTRLDEARNWIGRLIKTQLKKASGLKED